MAAVVGLLACLGFPLLVLAGVTGVINWTLGPLMKAARQTPTPTRFLLSDLFWLLLQLQLAMGAVAWAIPAEVSAQERIGALIFLGVPVALFWYACLHAVSQAGIQGPLRRAATFVVLFPGTVLSVVALPALVIAWLTTIHHNDETAAISLQLAIVAVGTFSLHWLARWVVVNSGA